MKLGGTDISKIYLGSTEVGKAYLGDVQVHGGASPVLPYDAEVTFLRSDGVAYINTGIPFTDNITVRAKIWFLNRSTSMALFGYRFTDTATANGNMRFFFVYNTNTNNGNGRRIGARFGNGAINSTDRVWTTVAFNDIVYDGTYLSVNGTNYLTISSRYSTSDYGEMYIFWANCEGYYSADLNKSEHPVSLFQIYDSGTLVRDYIPVRVGQVGYFYDRVSGQLFGNAADSGALLFGDDVTT